MKQRKLTVGSLISEKATRKHPLILEERPADSEEPAPSRIRFSQNERIFQITPIKKTSLLEAALQQNQAVNYKCKKGTCGLCTVKMITGTNDVHDPNEKEKNKLGKNIDQGFRLACQNITL